MVASPINCILQGTSSSVRLTTIDYYYLFFLVLKFVYGVFGNCNADLAELKDMHKSFIWFPQECPHCSPECSLSDLWPHDYRRINTCSSEFSRRTLRIPVPFLQGESAVHSELCVCLLTENEGVSSSILQSFSIETSYERFSPFFKTDVSWLLTVKCIVRNLFFFCWLLRCVEKSE